MKTLLKSTLGLAMLAGLTVGNAAHAQPQGFLQDIRQTQLSHITSHGSGVDGTRQVSHAMQTFGNEGGVLNDIWQSHYAGFSGHTDLGHAAMGHTLTSPRDFLTDVRRSQFHNSDV